MSRLRLIASLLALPFMAAVCAAAQPPAAPQPLPLAAAYANESTEQSGAVPDLSGWWRGFNDPVLNRLVASAQAENLDIRMAVARIDAARAVRLGAAAERQPDISLNADVGRHRSPAGQGTAAVTSNAAGLNAGVAWELDLFGRIRQNVAAADAGVASAEQDARAVMVAVTGEVVQGYLAVRGLQRRLALVGENARNQAETVVHTRRLFEAGAVPLADVNRAQSQAAATRAELPLLELQRQNAIHRIAIITASTPQEIYGQLNAGGPPPAWTPLARIGTPADLLRQRPDVRAAEARVIAAYARIGVAESELKPRLQLSGMLGAAIDGFSGATLARSIAWMVGAAASAPIADGGRRGSVVMLRRAQAEQMLYAYRSVVLAAVSEVETALAASGRGRQRVDDLTTAASSARAAYEQIHQSWRSGESAFIDTLEVQRTLLMAEDTLAQAQTSELQSQASLVTALGH
jgi:NodT family efflux transporter outer membrane factor (OMF) lipoprotein